MSNFELIFLNTPESDSITLKEKEMLFQVNQPAEKIFFIQEGSFKLTQSDGQKEFIARIADKGLIGHRSLFVKRNYKANAIALSDAKVLSLPKEQFLKAVTHNPELSLALMQKLTFDLELSDKKAFMLHGSNVRQKVARILLLLIESHGKEVGENKYLIQLKLTREEWASLISVAMENVVRTLSELKKSSVITENNSMIEVLDLEKLKQEAF